MLTAKNLMKLGGCPGWSEFAWRTLPFCRFYHALAHVTSTHMYSSPFWNHVTIYWSLYLIVLSTSPASILHKSIAGRCRPVSYSDGPTTARYRFMLNAYWERGILLQSMWQNRASVFPNPCILLQHMGRFKRNGAFERAQNAQSDYSAHAQSIIWALISVFDRLKYEPS